MIKKTFLFAISSLFSVGIFADSLNSGDTAWILTSTALVLLMTLPGLSLFYAGLVRSKNAISVLMQCFAIACIVSVAWVVYGYSLAFTEGNAFFGGTSAFFLSGIGRDTLAPGTTMPHSLFVIFQMTFAIITPALVVGAFAERMKFGAMCLFSLLWFTAVYIPACHMIWGGGYLADVKDFAGGLVVHLTCGVGALVVALFLGPRKGFPSTAMPPHNRTMVVTGAALLWVGWFGFNAGSSWAADGLAGMAMLVTHISAAVAALVWMSVEWIKQGKPTVVGIATGMVAGLATITPAAGTVGPEGALLIGLLAGVVCFYSTQLIKAVLKIDDSLDVFPVHGVGGILGTILTGVFASASYGGMGLDTSIFNQVIIQVIGVVFTIIWCGFFTYVILKFVDNLLGLRISDEYEETGIDLAEHGEKGYNS